jgi:hypothetical protein
MEAGGVTLETLAGGAAVELFNTELARVLANIADPNTRADAARTLTLEVTIKPTEDRDMGAVSVQALAKLAPIRPATTRIFFGRRQGKLVAVEHDPKQPGLFDSPTPAGDNVVPLSRPGGVA